MRGAAAVAVSLALAGAAAAQEDDRSYLTAFLEDNLSGAGRTVTITGFEGALSSRATIERIAIADDAGVWITLDGVVLDWSRSSLLSGEVVVNALTADRIELARLPQTADTGPSPEAASFALPELPVSISIGEIAADSIVLGAPVLGEPVEARLAASMTLAGGEGEASLLLERTDDGPAGEVRLEAAYANATRRIDLELVAREAADGIAARLLDLPGAPAAGLSVIGGGTPDDFRAEVRLETDGVARLQGPVTVALSSDGARDFAARLAGNPAPLFLPEYAAFIGDSVSLDLSGSRWPDGSLRIDALDVVTDAMRVSGRIGLAPDGLPQDFDLRATIGAADGRPVLLPLAGTETRIGGLEMTLAFDAANESGWTGRIDLRDVDRADARISRASVVGSGRIGRISGAASLGATLDFAVDGLAPADPALAAALGPSLTGQAVIHWRQDTSGLRLPRITLKGEGYTAAASLTVAGLDTAMRTSGKASLTADDLARFSALAGRPLGGWAEITVEGTASPITGAFDTVVAMRTRGLTTGIAQADALLAGPANLTAALRRDETGITLKNLDAAVASLGLTGAGTVTSDTSTLDLSLDWADLSDLGGGLGGALRATGRFAGTTRDGALHLQGSTTALRTGQPELDRLLSGTADLSLDLALADGVARLAALSLSSPNLTAEVAGEDDGQLRVSGRLSNLALIAPGFPGPVTLSGQVRPEGETLASDLRVAGPGGVDARISGRIAAGNPDLTITGTAEAAIANAFTGPVTLGGALAYDLALRGGRQLSSLSGRITLSGGTVAIPARGLALERVALAADIGGGQAQVSATAEAPRGGRLRADGTVGLTAPYAAALDIAVDSLLLRDPQLYSTRISGTLGLDGPLMGRALLAGRIVLSETEIRVPSTGFASAADLEAFTHLRDTAAVRATRARAGVGQATGAAGGGAAGGGPDWALDIEVLAPNRIFVRGRGLDAELGGSVRLGGTLSNVIPAGGLELIRGRLDLLGKRLVLSEATLSMEGSLVPYLSIAASNDADGVTSAVRIDGPADSPQVTFSSVPELPQEEVLAYLLFGRGLDTISAFQAAQLANAVAVLAGRGGEGIVARLRKGFGFDDLDIATDPDGGTRLSAGKYIAENVYSEFEVTDDGTSRINLNLDVRPGLTVKGRIDSDGESGIGVFLEKDY